jgi:hypothetical protein
MKKSLLINAVLVAAVLVLGLVAWLKPSNRDADFRLSTLKAADVKAVELVIGNSTPLTLQRTENGWEVAHPFPARGDAFPIQRLLELLDAKSGVRLPATGLARYGLNEPTAKVRLATQEFSFGAVNEMSREVYVLTGDNIYLVPLRYAALLPKSPLDLVSKQLFAAEEAPAGFDFGSFKVAQADGKWALTMTSTSVPASEAGPDDINRWVDEWRLAGALGVQMAGKRKPVGALQVTLKNGSAVVVKILERGDNTVVAREDEPIEYILSAETARRLLAPPGTIRSAAPAPAR